jgi:putative peptidoglycan lipid II flippase
VKRAALVAAGILASRLAGLVRLRVFAHYFGLQSDAADAFNAAFRIPNVLQNLFGEGALAASFIPVYAGLSARGDRERADRMAGAIGALLAVVVSLLVGLGVLAAPLLVAIIAPGFEGPKRDLTTSLVRILFPGAGLLVCSAWCLGILNSHRRFLLSYAAPVMWNAAMITTLAAFGPGAALPDLARWLAWGSVAGSTLQFAIQVPLVLKLAPGLSPRPGPAANEVRTVVRNFGPALIGRGVVQISAFIDTLLASLLPTGAVTALVSAQLIYTLPVSLFGMSIAAAELPDMAGESQLADTGVAHAALRKRLDAGLRRVAFFVVPSCVAFLAFGDLIAAALLQTGRFTAADSVYVWGILAGSAVGLLASTSGRLYSSAFYALRDPATPLRFAVARIVVSIAIGYLAAIHGPGWIGVPAIWGAAGITAAAGVAGWLEWMLLRRALTRRIGATGLRPGYVAVLWAGAVAGAGAAWFLRPLASVYHPIAGALLVLGAYGITFLLLMASCRVEDVRTLLKSGVRSGRSPHDS